MMRPERRFPFVIGLAAAALLLGLGLAQDASEGASEDPDLERRVITIDSSGGTQSGNLRYGPIVYEHPDPLGIVATVSNLTIRGPRAELSAPEDTLLAQAKGERTAAFDGGVQVTRGRLEADGPALVYREATGLGVLDGGVDVVIAASEDEGDPTEIEASLIEFDVDTDRSVSRGDVVLVNGTQRAEADALTYAETIDLGRLECEGLCTVIRGADDGTVMTITAQEIRVLTQDERLWARGQVTIVDGDITTRGSEAVYDDNEQIAEITGSPARSENDASGVTLESDRILQDIEFDFVEAIDASAASDVDLTAFLFEEEQGAGEPAAP
ncbi:MAG: LPS export ABC transporter periplasmic protein LptC [Deinococcus-Thermus bacterium]|jgi:lipopolysaccharide export system protein LptA|nr:LPS export ABC transporter periplasmic protein LptC [Deinococcota bacterium]